VMFGAIQNTTSGGAGEAPYHDYTNLSTNLQRGRLYELTIQAENSTANGSVAAWIDFNGNNSLDDEGERIMHIRSDESSQEFTVQVRIPDDAALGLTILRVRNSAGPDLFESCQSVDYGETEDYSINIIQTIQQYSDVPDFDANLLEDGNVDLNWSVPENPGVAHTEGFEMSMWPPQGGWDIKQSTSLTGTLNDPVGDTWTQFNSDYDYVYDGAYAALCPETALDFNWLITPQVLLYGNDQLSFMLNYSSDPGGYSKFYVMVESDGAWQTVLDYSQEITLLNNYDEQVLIDLADFAGKMVRFAFVTEYNDAMPVAIDDIVLGGETVTGKSVSGMTGYEIYKNGELLTTISDPSVTYFSDVLTATENYEYCIFATYDDNQKSDEACDIVFFLAPLTPPLNVVANAENDDVTVYWTAPNHGMNRFTDDFEDYTVGQQVACQHPDDWSTWTLTPCDANDPFITNSMAYSGANSVAIEYEADLLHLTDGLLEEGKYSINFRMYVPSGYNGYFNVLQDHDLTIGALWGMQAFFDQNAIGTLDAGGYGAATFSYEYDKWMHVQVVVDLDNDLGEFLIDDELIHTWQWSLSISGSGGWNTLEGIDFYAWSTNNTSSFYIDDFKIIQMYDGPDMVDYNVYRDGSMIGNTSETTFNDNDVSPGYHEYCVSALYDEGESDQVCDFITIYTAPANFTAELQNMNDVYCSWDAISSPDLDGYKVYRDGEAVSGTVTGNEFTDEGVEGGTHIYYVVAVYANGESLPSESQTVIILLVPQDLTAAADGNGNIGLSWESVGEVQDGQMVDLYQHDNDPVNGMYQSFNLGYGVVFDLSAYPGSTVEMADFHHASWGTTGTWSYIFHIVDWSNFSEIGFAGPFQTTGDDTWEFEIPLGSIDPGTTQVGIFLEPLSNDPADAYPVLSCDVAMGGYSLYCDLNDFTLNDVAPGDFLLDLWIYAPNSDKLVKAEKIKVDNSNLNARMPFEPVKGEITVKQMEKGGKALTGYNIYYAHNEDPFALLDQSTDTTYTHINAGTVIGLHNYYVTANYDEGESEASNTATEIISTSEQTLSESFRLFPNPASDMVTIEAGVKIESVSLVNAQGFTIYNLKEIDNTSLRIPVNSFSAGIYNLRIKTPDGWINKKLVIQ
ncbi:MAG: choice-of-anchor J domain-containing protein, partial [Bacteroidales bacterium]|nr:choice-of-anchor J domain-containing protein [Bacteroidales bacterium]